MKLRDRMMQKELKGKTNAKKSIGKKKKEAYAKSYDRLSRMMMVMGRNSDKKKLV